MPSAWSTRKLLDGASIAVALAVLAIAVLGLHGSWSQLLVAVFILGVPGWALISPWRIQDATFEVVVAVATSIALGTTVSLLVIGIGGLELRWGVALLAAASVLRLATSMARSSAPVMEES